MHPVLHCCGDMPCKHAGCSRKSALEKPRGKEPKGQQSAEQVLHTGGGRRAGEPAHYPSATGRAALLRRSTSAPQLRHCAVQPAAEGEEKKHTKPGAPPAWFKNILWIVLKYVQLECLADS